MDEGYLVDGHEVPPTTHRILQKSTGKEIGMASVYPRYLRCVDTMNTQLVHCDKLNVPQKPRSNELFVGSNELSQLQQDLYLTDSEDEVSDDEHDKQANMNVCDEVDEETKEQARLVEEMIVDESENETSFDEWNPHDSSKSFSATSTSSNTNKLTLKSFYEEVDGQKNVVSRKNRKVRCKLCKIIGQDRLISIGNFSTHIRNIHEEERRTKCPHCDKSYKKETLRSHIRDVHRRDPKVRCPQCHKEISRSNLNRHIKDIHGSKGKDKANDDEQGVMSSKSHDGDYVEDVEEESSGSPHQGKDITKPKSLKEGVRIFHEKVCNEVVAMSSPRRESPRRKKFKCGNCSKEFLLSRGLKSHQKKCPSNSN